jgi:hypothetical protein
MRFILLLVSLVLSVAGCTPAVIKDEVRLNALRCDRYVELMVSKQTTPDQDIEFVKANGAAWKALAKRWE